MRTITISTLSLLFVFSSTAAFSQSTAPNDAQIAVIVVAENSVDIDVGKLAEGKASSGEVKKFAQQMVTDHAGVNKQATALVQKLNVTPEDNATSKSLKDAGNTNEEKLKSLKGKEFDKAYVDNEVTYHQTVIDALNKTLIPSAKNAELKDLPVKVRPAFVAHLEHAKQVQSALK
jgi:putative membrane protein